MSINIMSCIQSLNKSLGPKGPPPFSTAFSIVNPLFNAQSIPSGNNTAKYFSPWTTGGDVSNTWVTNNNISLLYGTLANISPQYTTYEIWCQLANTANAPVSFTQSCPMPIGTYSISIWVAPRKTYYNSSMSFVIKINGQNVFTPVTFTTATATTPYTQFTGTYTETTGAYRDIVLYFINTASNDSIMFISNLVITKTA